MGSNFLKCLYAEFHQFLNMYLAHNCHRYLFIYYLTKVAFIRSEFIIMQSNSV